MSVARQERAAVVDVRGDPRILVGPVRVVLTTEPQQRRVDLDRVDVLDAPCASAIATSVPVPAPTIEHVLRRARHALVGR